MISDLSVEYPGILLITATVVFIVYWFSAGVIDRPLGQPGARREFAVKKGAGFLLLGLVPLGVAAFVVPNFSFALVGLKPAGPNPLFSILGITVAAAIIIPLTYRANAQGGDTDRYPELRLNQWNPTDFILWALGWFLFLFAYELLFRGVLFLLILPSLGFPVTLGINLAVYALSHIQKGLREAAGSLVLGTVLCFATAWSGTIWIAVWIHLTLALCNGIWAIRALSKETD